MKKLLLVAMLALVGCAASNGLTKPDSPLMALDEARCEAGPAELPGSQVCAQLLQIRPDCTVVMNTPVDRDGKPMYLMGLVCGVEKK